MKKVIPINYNLNIILSEEHPQYPIFGYLQPDEQKQLSSIQCVNMNRYRFILLLNRTLDFFKTTSSLYKSCCFLLPVLRTDPELKKTNYCPNKITMMRKGVGWSIRKKKKAESHLSRLRQQYLTNPRLLTINLLPINRTFPNAILKFKNKEELNAVSLLLGKFFSISQEYMFNKFALGYSNGDVFIGQWNEGRQPKRGKMTYTDGAVYDGWLKNGRRHGPGKMTYADGSVYIGQWENNHRQGLGKMTYTDGAVYKGKWENNHRQGLGKMTYAYGSVYIGQWENGRREGPGKMTYPNGDVYDGMWKDNKKNGRGKFTYADGAVCDGIWKNGSQESGKMTYTDGAVYYGWLKNGRREGMGTMAFPSGTVYKGMWANGHPDGLGKITWGNGEAYYGYWKNGRQQGRGKMTSTNGAVYDGYLENGRGQGPGIMTYPNGDVYKGMWKDGNRHGKGIMTYADGSVYIGEWENGRREGPGKMTYPNGDVHDGEWKNDQKHGMGKMTYANRDVYDGEWKNDQKHGMGKYTWDNGDVYDGMWENGRREGLGTMTYANGEKYRGDWKNAKRHGSGTYTWNNGDVYNGEWENDLQHGDGEIIYSDGKKYDGGWQYGDYHGQGILTYPDGYKDVGEFRSGKLNGHAKTYGPDENLIYDGQLKNGLFHGKGKLYRDNGNIGYEGIFEDNAFHGQGKLFRSDGSLEYSGQFIQGVRLVDKESAIRIGEFWRKEAANRRLEEHAHILSSLKQTLPIEKVLERIESMMTYTRPSCSAAGESKIGEESKDAGDKGKYKVGDLYFDSWWNNIRKCGEMSYVLPQRTINKLWEKVTLEKCDILLKYWGGDYVEDGQEWPWYAKVTCAQRNPTKLREYLLQQTKYNETNVDQEVREYFILGIILNNEILKRTKQQPIKNKNKERLTRVVVLEPGEIYKTGALNFQVQVSSGTPQATTCFQPEKRKGKVIRPEDGYSVYPFTAVVKNYKEEPEKTVPVHAGNIKTVITTCGMNVPIANLGVRIEYERQKGMRHDQLTSGAIARIAQASGERPYPGGESNQWHDWRHSVRQLYLYRNIKELTLNDQYSDLQLSSEENLALELAIYFVRSGRVDEKSWQDQGGDKDFRIRSFDIYSQYAKQFEISDEICKLIKSVMLNSCIPEAYLSKEIKDKKRDNLKLSYALDTLELVHTLDALRLEYFIEQERMDGINSQITAMTKKLFRNDSQSEQQLRSLAKSYIKRTGPIDRSPNSLSPIDVCRSLENT